MPGTVPFETVKEQTTILGMATQLFGKSEDLETLTFPQLGQPPVGIQQVVHPERIRSLSTNQRVRVHLDRIADGEDSEFGTV